MRSRIINLAADGTWQTLGAGQNFPENTYAVTMQARNPQNGMNYRYYGVDAYMTVRAGGVAQLKGKYDPGDIQVMGTNGDVIEIECDTNVSNKWR